MSKRVVAAILSAAFLVGCSSEELYPPASPQERIRIVMIGLDGFEWRVAAPLLREGRLPNLARLIGRGAHGRLATLSRTASPIIWTSIATGYGMETHGITGFTIDEPGGKRLVNSTDRRTKAFWNVLSELGLRVATIGWWVTWPVEPVNGLMIAQVNTLRPLEGMAKGGLLEELDHQVYPAERQREVLARAGEVAAGLEDLTQRILGGPWIDTIGPLPNRLWKESEWSIRTDAIYLQLALDALGNEEPFDLLAVYMGGADVLGHRFWRYFEPEEFAHRPSELEIEQLGSILPDYYAYLDREVGAIVARAPEDATIIVLSDHGMHAARTDARFEADSRPKRMTLSGGHQGAPPAFFVAAGPGIRAGAVPPAEIPELGSVVDVFPTLCALLGIPLARDFEGGAMTDVVDPEHLERHPLHWVDTYSPVGWRREAGPVVRPADHELERMKQLRSLGYIQ